MGVPLLETKVSQKLRERVCNSKAITIGADAIEICGQDNNRQGVIIQNLSAVNAAFVVFAQNNVVTTAMRIPPTGNMAFDFSIGQSLYAFTAGAAVNLAIVEVSGFDTFQILMAKLVEICADRLDSIADILALTAVKNGVDKSLVRKALKSELTT